MKTHTICGSHCSWLTQKPFLLLLSIAFLLTELKDSTMPALRDNQEVIEIQVLFARNLLFPFPLYLGVDCTSQGDVKGL